MPVTGRLLLAAAGRSPARRALSRPSPPPENRKPAEIGNQNNGEKPEQTAGPMYPGQPSRITDPVPAGGEEAPAETRSPGETENARHALARRVALLKLAFQHLERGVSVVDANLRLIAYNRRFIELLGLPEERFPPGTPLETLVRFNAERGEYRGGDVEALVREHLERARRAGTHHSEHVRPGGTVVEIRHDPLPGGGFVATYTDVTERKRTEQALQESETRFRDFAESAADWFWETDAAHRFTYFSRGMETHTQIPLHHLIGRTRHECFAEADGNSAKWASHQADLDARRPFSDLRYFVKGPDGTTTRVISVSGRPVFGEDGTFLGYRGAGRDMTTTHRLTEDLNRQAAQDPLTGLLNRREFERRLRELLQAAEEAEEEHALCYIDLDEFKVVNDTCGHAAGDALLKDLSALLSRKIRRHDLLARLGGDEFGVLLLHCPLRQAQHIAEGLREAIEDFRFVWKGQTFCVGASIGLTPIFHAGDTLTDVMAIADSACYLAKEHGRNRVYVYHKGDTAVADKHEQMRWVGHMQEAIDEDRLRLHYQPIVRVDGVDEGYHYELLVRLVDPRGRRIPPGAFLPAAERYHLSGRLDRWVVSRALGWLGSHPEHVRRLFVCSINLSGQSLGDEGFLKFLVQELRESAVPAHKLCFEVTETAAITSFSTALRFMETLKAWGCRFALDDFGSGLSSFTYLKALPVDFLKIDGRFVKHIAHSPVDMAVVKSINEIGHAMGKKTVAEHVDSDAVLDKLQLAHLGVDYAQGYYLGRPRPVDRLA